MVQRGVTRIGGVVLLLFLAALHAACGNSSDGEAGGALFAATAQPGEVWGGFVFYSETVPFRAAQTPGPAQPVRQEETIPHSHPGLRQFPSVPEAAAGLGGAVPVPAVDFVPAGYEVLGVWAIESDGRIVDCVVEYGRTGIPTRPFSPHLSIGWTLRAPHPLPALTTGNQLPSGQTGKPVVKVEVLGQRGVFQEWVNQPGAPVEAGVRSSLNWFDDEWRLWFVQAYDEPLDVLLKVADNIETRP